MFFLFPFTLIVFQEEIILALMLESNRFAFYM